MPSRPSAPDKGIGPSVANANSSEDRAREQTGPAGSIPATGVSRPPAVRRLGLNPQASLGQMKRRTYYDPLVEQEIDVNPVVEAMLLVVLGILFAAYVAVLVYRITVPKLPFQAMVYTFASLSLVHAIYLLGWRRA